ncbi:glycoside hydrolase family 51 protein [Phanerochaete carnosa HHB-10118-sp]|uniref:non-reducing end alpha-L-arabinofuranosidase n=1 Tax=Phanerochaete carnosa (strain HHB-10118-sp) TaxID=650164 RepID=K5VZC4_PHACS|nr:glycoside hydrolase family 51 protein [Phanerochaete carnosa HHB-10118-sp]EKM56923.1 glycoside hydrolase family 51 protein [Phanerochaete carnosa HHB-10118-sp]
MHSLSSWVLGILGIGAAVCQAAVTTVSVSATASHAIPTTLFGQMFEDINSGDGGLYAEMLQNRAFQQVTPGTSDALDFWSAIAGANIAVIADPKPVSDALPNSLQVSVPGKSTTAGFANSGFWGINVNSSWTYTASFYYKFPTSSSQSVKFTVELRSASGKTLASSATTASGTATTWKQVQLTLKPTTSAPDVNNQFVVLVQPSGSATTTVDFAMFSLFPPTFKGRSNGMRMDIAETLVEMGPKFFRFPGGNNLEVRPSCRGQTTATRWQWNATVGSLLDRPGRVGDWGYVNTDGLGLLEYLQFFEDADMEPIMAVWSGYSLGGTSLPENELAPYIQQSIDQACYDLCCSASGHLSLYALDQLHYSRSSQGYRSPGALRASLGHPEPFTLNYVEIGNEDFFAADTYPYRFQDFVGNLSKAFPQLTFIATSDVGDPTLTPTPQAYDVHVYQTPGWFAQNVFSYDSFARDGQKYFEGEYAAISTNANDLFGTPSDGRLTFPTMQSSSGEAAFMTGLERNSDIVFAASYAPLLQHVNSTQWTPDLVSFDAGSVVRSTSFYTQKLFATNQGDEFMPSTLPNQNGTVFWSISRLTSTLEVIIKIANSGNSSAQLAFALPFSDVASSGTLQLLTGAETASNTPEAPNTVVPKTSTITTGKTIDYTAPAFSVSIIRVVAS